jgi:preprotein translocase subunit SecG
MLYGLLITLFIIVCLSLIFLVLVQKGKGSMGLGSMGGSTQMLFGGSGGQDLFQKITWTLGACFMGGSLVLGLMKS